MTSHTANLISNPDFEQGEYGQLPTNWTIFSPQPYLTPQFSLENDHGKKVLSIRGNGNANCIGWVSSSFELQGGQTYRMYVRFKASPDINPYNNLLFSYFSSEKEIKCNNGIFEFMQISSDEFSGESKFFVPGEGTITGEVRLAYKLIAEGHAQILNVGMEVTDPIPERNVRVACIKGYSDDMQLWERVLDTAASHGADLVLLPETFTGDNIRRTEQTMDGQCASLMARKAKEHKFYVSGTFFLRDQADGHLYNAGLLFDRQGTCIGRYDKLHPFSPEFLEKGVTPGSTVPVFETDFGKIGMMICYDSWFTDVAELAALKGAEILLFPNAAYYRSIIPARANDNGVRIMSSSMYDPAGIWDSSGADVENPNFDPTRNANNDRTFKDVVKLQLDEVEILLATLDLNQTPSAHNWGGPMMSSPGGRRNRREQKRLLYDEIQTELNKQSSF